jgi:hypothetical protein
MSRARRPLAEDFLRPPRRADELVADALRLVGIVSVPAAAIWWQPTDAGVLALALPALMVPRMLAVRPGADIFYGVTVLVAAWSNVLGLYRSIAWWDLLIHFVCTGVLAAAAYLALARARIVPVPDRTGFTGRGAVVLTTIIGLALCAVWEMIEWAGWRFISDAIYVGYQDTIGDMVVGGVGAVVAGVVVARVRLIRRDAASLRAGTPRDRSLRSG